MEVESLSPNSLVTEAKPAEEKKPRRYDSLAAENLPPAWANGFKLRPEAKYLSISEPSLRHLEKNGQIKANKKTRHLIFSRTELDRWLLSGQ